MTVAINIMNDHFSDQTDRNTIEYALQDSMELTPQMITARNLKCIFTTAAVGPIFDIKTFLLALESPCVQYFCCSIDTVQGFKRNKILPKKNISTKKFADCWIANSTLTENEDQERNMWIIECR